MRLLVCDHHVLFAESLAHVLTTHGKRVVAVTHRLDDAIKVLRRERVDICLLDVAFGADSEIDRLGELRDASPGTRVVLLSGEIDESLLLGAKVAGVRGVADKRFPVADIIELLDQVEAGETVLLTDRVHDHRRVHIPRQRPANDAQRLARFLTPREREVLSALVRGVDTNRMAGSLGIAAATARCHIQSVLTKMGAHSRLEVATTAVRYGMVSPETGEWLIPVS